MAELPEVTVKPEQIGVPSSSFPDTTVYQSSEQVQRQRSADVFAREENDKQTTVLSQQQRLEALLDTYIAEHSSTKKVRELAKENKNVEKYGADYQLDLSADIVTILEKIKSKLG